MIANGEVRIDVLVGDHGEVEVVTLGRPVGIGGAEQLNELRHKKTRGG